jgi:ATP-binding cassette subfamily B protein
MKHLFRLIPFLRPYWGPIALAGVTLLALTGLNLIIPTIIRQVIDVGLGQRQVSFLFNAALLILGIGVAHAVIVYANRYLSEWIAAHIGYDLRNRLYDHIQHLPFTYHDHSQTGQIISRCIEDVRAIERFTGFGVIELLRVVLLMVGITTLLFFDNPWLAAIVLIPMIPLTLITTHFGQRIGKYFYAVDNALGDLSARLQENVSGAQVVRAFAREPYEIDRFDQANRALYQARVRVIGQWANVLPSTHFMVTAGTILILWFGGQMVLNSEMTLGELVAFNSYLLMLAGPTQQLTWLVNAAGEAAAGAQRSFEVLDTMPEIQSPPQAIDLPPLSGQIEFRDVCFHYQGETAQALEDIRLTVEPNQIVALIGPTGSGKTSLINLIPRFYDISEGAVLVDDYDVRTVDLVSLRKQIGIVLQTSLLFSVSVRENIAYGRPDASLDDVVEAAKAAQAHEFITQLPDGYDTVVGERGVTLSGGQRQRVAIARALLMNPRILILDDSTSSVDTHTERLIQQALDRLMEGRTTFVIAHRLSTVRRADLILVMDRGRIVERGTHRELLTQGGLYREIYELQLRDQERFVAEMEMLGENGRQKVAVQKTRGIE